MYVWIYIYLLNHCSHTIREKRIKGLKTDWRTAHRPLCTLHTQFMTSPVFELGDVLGVKRLDIKTERTVIEEAACTLTVSPSVQKNMRNNDILLYFTPALLVTAAIKWRQPGRRARPLPDARRTCNVPVGFLSPEIGSELLRPQNNWVPWGFTGG